MISEDTIRKLYEETKEIEIAAIRSYYDEDTSYVYLMQAPYYDPSMKRPDIDNIPFLIGGRVIKDFASRDPKEIADLKELMDISTDQMTAKLDAAWGCEIVPTIDLGKYEILKTEVLKECNCMGIIAVKLYLKRKT